MVEVGAHGLGDDDGCRARPPSRRGPRGSRAGRSSRRRAPRRCRSRRHRAPQGGRRRRRRPGTASNAMRGASAPDGARNMASSPMSFTTRPPCAEAMSHAADSNPASARACAFNVRPPAHAVEPTRSTKPSPTVTARSSTSSVRSATERRMARTMCSRSTLVMSCRGDGDEGGGPVLGGAGPVQLAGSGAQLRHALGEEQADGRFGDPGHVPLPRPG